MEDRLLTDKIVAWLESQQNETRPFFLMINWNNNHYPFQVDEDFKPSGSESEQLFQRAVHSGGMTDRLMTRVLSSWNTIIGFVSDHGESAPAPPTRISNPDSRYLSSPI
jgi:arylsulfatase A-like enzyme